MIPRFSFGSCHIPEVVVDAELAVSSQQPSLSHPSSSETISFLNYNEIRFSMFVTITKNHKKSNGNKGPWPLGQR